MRPKKKSNYYLMESETMAETHIHVYINERVYKTQLFMQFKKN